VPSTPPKIAIVDDVSIGKALSRLLSVVSWHAVPFVSAEAFLQTGLQEPPHCLLLEVQLPGMTGWELLAHLEAAGIAFPVILLTTDANAEFRRRAARARVAACLQKPVDAQDLLQAIQRALGQAGLRPRLPTRAWPRWGGEGGPPRHG